MKTPAPNQESARDSSRFPVDHDENLDAHTLLVVIRSMEDARASTLGLERAYSNCCDSDFDTRQVDLARIRAAELSIWIDSLREALAKAPAPTDQSDSLRAEISDLRKQLDAMLVGGPREAITDLRAALASAVEERNAEILRARTAEAALAKAEERAAEAEQMLRDSVSTATNWEEMCIAAEAKLAQATEALEKAEAALVDLGACDDAACITPGCNSALPAIRAALAAIREVGS